MVFVAVGNEMFCSVLVLFFSLIHFFSLLSTDIFLPTPDSLLVNLHESKEV